MGDPAAGAIQFLGGARAGHGKLLDHGDERLDAFAEVGFFRRPIVHFGIDVDGVFAAPRRVHAVIPQPLLVGGLECLLKTRTGRWFALKSVKMLCQPSAALDWDEKGSEPFSGEESGKR